MLFNFSRTNLSTHVLILLLSMGVAVAQCEPLLYSTLSRQKISLNTPNLDWSLRSSDGRISVPGNVPGDVYRDLQLAGVIPDPIKEFNDVKTRWVASCNWTYEAKFTVNNSLITSGSSIDLVMEGVDTIGHVTLNGQSIIDSCNSHWREYRVGVKHLLLVGFNSLNVELKSPLSYARASAQDYSNKYGYPVPPDCPPDSYDGECSFNFIRKPAFSFSWDWGPAVPTSGLWRPVYLDVYPGLAIDYVKFAASPAPEAAEFDNVWLAVATVGVLIGDNSVHDKEGQICLAAKIDEITETVKQCAELQPAMRRAYMETKNLTVNLRFDQIRNPQLWWPNGYGNQSLYTLRVRLCLDGPECRLPDSWETRRVSFRRIELQQKPVGSQLGSGLTFGLAVNGHSIFIKGSNFVPIGMSIAGASAGDYNWLMRSAADVGINMLRVWGGGTIERPEFYDLADQLGIMIWQDFPFACALYPTNDEFLSIVESEIRTTVRRLQHRASLAVWVGNNENEGALANQWWPLWQNRTQRYYQDYRLLYMQTLRRMVQAEDATRSVLLSSPSNGDETEWEGGVARQPQSTLFGDVHFYSYTEDMWLPETTPLARLMSEFGFQSYPSLLTVLSATDYPANIGVDTNFTLHREHQPNGTVIIARHNERHFASQQPDWLVGINDQPIGKLLAENYSVPPVELKQLTAQLALYAYKSYASQVDQAEIYRRVTHRHALYRCRLRQSVSPDSSEGFSSGVMYWQLNDVWAAPTWSSIEFTGAWKVAHYYAKRYYANRRVAMVKSGYDDQVEAIYIQESDVSSANSPQLIVVEFKCYDVNSLTPLRSWTVTTNWTSPNCPTELFRQSEAELLKRCGCTLASNCFLEARVVSAKQQPAPSPPAEQYFFDAPKNFKRTKMPQLTINITKTGLDKFQIDLSSQSPLYAVHLQFLCPSMARSVLSDNAFHLTAGYTSVELTQVPGNKAATEVKQYLLMHYL